ncbi:MAG: DUF2922 domain-containing protein [Selenomonadaceae bacterium]
MSKVLKMVFNLEGAKTLTYSLPDPKDGLTKAAVEAVMNNMITQQAVVVDGIYPQSIKEAVIKSTEEIALA